MKSPGPAAALWASMPAITGFVAAAAYSHWAARHGQADDGDPETVGLLDARSRPPS